MIKPKISLLIENAFKQENEELIKDLYRIRDYVTEDLDLIFNENPEVMEDVVRILARIDLTQKILGGKFTVRGCPKKRRPEIRWFIRLFALLESAVCNWDLTEEDVDYPANSFHRRIFSDPRINVEIDISDQRFLYRRVSVAFLPMGQTTLEN